MVITDDNISDEHVKQMEESQNNYKVACVENINNNILSEI
jgi:isocitrate dehydrogenase